MNVTVTVPHTVSVRQRNALADAECLTLWAQMQLSWSRTESQNDWILFLQTPVSTLLPGLSHFENQFWTQT